VLLDGHSEGRYRWFRRLFVDKGDIMHKNDRKITKLGLKKATIRQLTDEGMGKIVGGGLCSTNQDLQGNMTTCLSCKNC
jgi:hypothetical protein